MTSLAPTAPLVGFDDGSAFWHELELETGISVNDGAGWTICANNYRMGDLDHLDPEQAEALAADLLRAADYCRQYRAGSLA